MYFVDRQKIEEILNYMEKLLDEFTGKSYQTFSDYLVLERLTHLVIEAIIDVGNMMIDGFIMRDPGSYSDIIDILSDEEVIPEEEEHGYKAFIQLRKMIVQNYTQIDHKEVEQTWGDQFRVLSGFPERIRCYLDEELGPVSAFSKE